MLEFSQYRKLVQDLKQGKHLPDAVYMHKKLFSAVAPELNAFLRVMLRTHKLKKKSWNVVKLNKRSYKISILNYPDFDTYAYPSLHQSFTIDVTNLNFRKADYSKSDNPPILHRKETLVADEYKLFDLFQEITKEGEAIGLYENTRSIGFKNNWNRLIKSKGYCLDETGRLQQIEKKALRATVSASQKVERHKTAIDRNKLSAPMQILARHNYFDGTYSILDYGCGKRDDVRELESHGLDIAAWDPVHYPEGQKRAANIVNLGFVLNVIEEQDERLDTLKQAYGLTEKMLIVSVMIAGDSVIRQFQPFGDGVLTSRNTFQRYYSQNEFKEYLEESLAEEAIAVGQGIFILFKDKLEEQHYLLERQHVRRHWKQQVQRPQKVVSKQSVKEPIEKHKELFTHFWETTLDFGRIPANDEFEFSDQVRHIFGSHKKAFDALIEYYGKENYQLAQEARRNDLLLYFALGLFGRRRPYIYMPEELKRDIKVFFGKYTNAIEEATKLLFSVGNPELIEESSVKAFEQLQIGEFNNGHSWVIPKELVSDLPPELRVYIGCASQLYGDLDPMHLVKIHFTSGKVSLMRYDDFSKEEPLLIQRIKIKLRDQAVDFFDYGDEYEPPPLLNRELF